MAKGRWFTALLIPAVAFGLWWLGADSGRWSTYLLPSPRQVGEALKDLMLAGVLWRHVEASLYRVLAGFALATLTAVPLAVLTGLWQRVARLLYPTLEFFRHVPPLAMLPMLILWLGIGESSKLSIVFLATFYPIFLNTFNGMQRSDAKLLELSRQYALPPHVVFWHIRLPQAAPYVYTGLRIGLGYSWRALIGAEMIAAASGVGYLILDAQAMARSDLVVAGIVTIGLCGMVMDYVFVKVSYGLFGKYLRTTEEVTHG